jgi:pyruvate dehydrogenase E2 component (dihydrolipoamide acetyltransferase)
MSSPIHGLVIPKYGMVMTEGVISNWYVEEGASVAQGDELVDIETEKVANVYESPHSGVLRRKLVAEGQSLPVGSLFGVISSPEIADADIDAYVQKFQSEFVPTDARSTTPAPEVVDIDAGYIRFLKLGDAGAAPVVLIHGFGADLNNWLLNHSPLAHANTVYAVELPGHGGSVKNPRIASLDDLAAAVVSFLDAKSLRAAHLVGHSLGGGVAAQIAIEHPGRVKSLTLLAPIGLGKEINFTFIKGLLEADRRKEMQAVLETLFHDPSLVSRDMATNVLNSKRIDGAVTCLRAIAERCFPAGEQATLLRDALSRLSLPIQLIWGESDRIIPAAHAASLPKTVAVHRLDDTGHMVHMEKAAAVNELIGRFIEAAEPRPA